jgi:hypothetical protein
MLAVSLLAFQDAASAQSGTQRFHIVYAGPFDPADPPERSLTAVGPIQGKGHERFISEGPGPEPGTMLATTELVLSEGTVMLTLSGTGEFRFNARACIGFNTSRGSWVITGATGAYAGASGQGTFEGRNILSGRRTPEGCPSQPDRLISNLRLVGTVTVAEDQAA